MYSHLLWCVNYNCTFNLFKNCIMNNNSDEEFTAMDKFIMVIVGVLVIVTILLNIYHE
jgi:hypothetical protein